MSDMSKFDTVEKFAAYLADNYLKFDSYMSFIKYPEDESWAVVEPCHRDSDSVSRSNWIIMQREIAKVAKGGESPERWMVVEPGTEYFTGGASHWAVGHVDQLHMRVYEPDGTVTPVFKKYYELMQKMDSYPILDDDHHSELEYEDALESIRSVLRGKLRDDVKEGWEHEIHHFLTEGGQCGDYEIANSMWDEIIEAAKELGYLEPDE